MMEPTMDVTVFVRHFEEYVRSFAGEDGRLAFAHELKRKHTLEVLDFSRRIMTGEAPQGRGHFSAGELAALFHDLARFEQYRIYRSFKDCPEFNHGHRAAAMLEDGDWLEGLPEKLRREVTEAVRVHNALRIPADFPQEFLFTAKVVRDADKLSIFCVVLDFFQHREAYRNDPAVALELPETPTVRLPLVRKVLAGETESYSSLASTNDFIINLFSWARGLEFGTSRKMALELEVFPRLRALLPPSPELDELLEVTGKILRKS